MATARELLEQADSLMRRNRSRAEADIPVLTDVVAEPSAARAPPAAEVPVLTETVEEIIVEIPPLPEEAALGESSLWPDPDTIDPAQYSITGPSPDTVAVVPPVTLKAADSELAPPLMESRTGPAAVAGPSDDERWRLLGEQVSMQVLQRIDLFTDTGLNEQLKEHLRPIVDRASSELVNAINQHVGQILRTYISEAIEREIEQWRHDRE